MPKPSADEVLAILREGNKRFCLGQSQHPHNAPERTALAGRESEADHAMVTILSCSDSRVPPELVFDLGIMDAFVIRVGGNVMNNDEIGCIEYGLCHVETPVLLLLGHTRCDAITVVTEMALGHTHKLERHIPSLLSTISPCVQKVIHDHPDLVDQSVIVEKACVENIWIGLFALLRKSAAVRKLLEVGKIKIAPAIYEVHSGKVDWLDENMVASLLAKAVADPEKETNVYA